MLISNIGTTIEISITTIVIIITPTIAINLVVIMVVSMRRTGQLGTLQVLATSPQFAALAKPVRRPAFGGRTRVQGYVTMYIRTYIHEYIHTCIHACINAYTCMHACTCLIVHVYTYVH